MVSYARGQAARGVRLHSIYPAYARVDGGAGGCAGMAAFPVRRLPRSPGPSPETLFSALPLVNQPLAA